MSHAVVTPRARVLIADRGDALTPHLNAALSERYTVVGRVDAELTRVERLLVAGVTFRPSRRSWVERFYKSNLAVTLRSRRADSALRAVEARSDTGVDVVVQTHALFALGDPRAVLYVDCTHRQSADHWPDWNPLRGRALQRWLVRERRQYHGAAHLFAFSEPTRASLVDDYGVPAERVTVVGAGVNFDRLPTQRSRPADAAPTVLFVGNDFERKGGPQLLEAFRLVRARVPGARLQVVGTPHPIPPQDGVEVIGRVDGREAMSRLYAAASVFVLPSTFDPFPLVVLEAMAHGLPVVATRQCGVPEMVVDGTTGMLVEPGDDLVPQLVEALVQVLGDPADAARLGAAGRRRVAERFLWSHVVDRMAPALETMAPGPRTPTARTSPVTPSATPPRAEPLETLEHPADLTGATR
ncbi:MAG: glycosyltransferase family 4 protein [Actinomycetota bacterium]|nr:glycosyltransferase family 4 protein [Actinomycetota bacterium]